MYTKVYKNMQIYIYLYLTFKKKSMNKLSKACKFMQNYGKVCKSIEKYTKKYPNPKGLNIHSNGMF